MLAATLSVATSAPRSYVRGRALVEEPRSSEVVPAEGATVFVLLPRAPGTGRLPLQALLVDDDGRAEVPTFWHDRMPIEEGDLDQPLLIGWAVGRGVDIERAFGDATVEQEGRLNVFVLGDHELVVHARLRLTRLGHAPPLEVKAGWVTLPPASFDRWLVFARPKAPVARWVPASEVPAQVAVPPGFAGEVFAAWGSEHLAPRLTTPVPVRGGEAL